MKKPVEIASVAAVSTSLIVVADKKGRLWRGAVEATGPVTWDRINSPEVEEESGPGYTRPASAGQHPRRT